MLLHVDYGKVMLLDDCMWMRCGATLCCLSKRGYFSYNLFLFLYFVFIFVVVIRLPLGFKAVSKLDDSKMRDSKF